MAANRFTGWVDVPLSRAGIDEALDAGRRIADLPIDEVHMSTLLRAQQTAMIALAERSDGRASRDGSPLKGKWSGILGRTSVPMRRMTPCQFT